MKALHFFFIFGLLSFEAYAQNRLQRFLMMDRKKQETKTQPQTVETEGVYADPMAVSDLRAQLDALRKANEALQVANSNLSVQLQDLQQQIVSIKDEAKSNEEELTRSLKAAASIRDKAIRERDEMSDDLARLKSNFNTYKEKQITAQGPEIETTSQLESLTAELQRQSEKVLVLEQEKATIKSSLEAELKREQTLVRAYEKEKIHLSQRATHTERDLNLQLDDAKKSLADLKSKHDQLRTACEVALNSKDDSEQEVLARVAAEIRKVELEVEHKWQSDIAKLKEESQKKVEEVESKSLKALSLERQKSERELQLLKATHANELQTFSTAHKSEIDQLNSELADLRQQVSDLTNEKLLTSERARLLEENLNETLQEALFWESSFRDRSVFNMTYVACSVKDVASMAIRIVEASTAPWRDYWVAVYKNNLKEFYDETLQPQVSAVYHKTMKRYVDELLSRVISSAYPVLSDGRKQYSEAVVLIDEYMTANFREICMIGRDTLVRMRSPLDIIAGVDARCQNSSASVRSLMELIAVLMMVIFGRSILMFLTRAGLWVVLFVPRTVASILTAPPSVEGGKRRKLS